MHEIIESQTNIVVDLMCKAKVEPRKRQFTVKTAFIPTLAVIDIRQEAVKSFILHLLLFSLFILKLKVKKLNFVHQVLVQDI